MSAATESPGRLDATVPLPSPPTLTPPTLQGSLQGSLIHKLPDVPGFDIVAELGFGGMAVVYLARQIALDRMVALKMMRPDVAVGVDGLARFLGEARHLASLQHPNIVQIHEVGVYDGGAYLVLELVDGGSLDHKVHGKPQPIREAAQLVETLARAVAFAHAAGVIHRDLKPGNVLLSKSGVPRIADFGIAKRLDGDSKLTRTGVLMGTPSYMAPEQITPDALVGPAADIYALGGILYCLLVGDAPFSGKTEAVLHAVTDEPATAPRRLRREVPRDLETICCKCLEKDPARRYTSADALADDLHRFLAGEPIVARPVSVVGRFTRWSRRHPTTAVLGGVSVALLGTIAVGATLVALRLSDQDRELERERDGEVQAHAAADASRKLATEQRDLAIESYYTLVTSISDKLGDKPELRPVRHAVLDDALAGLRKLASSGDAASLEADRATAAGHVRLGDVFEELGQIDDARREYERALASYRKLATGGDVSARYDQATTDHRLGQLARDRGDIDEALPLFRAELDVALALDTQPHDPAITPERILALLGDSYTDLALLANDRGDSGDGLDQASHLLDVAARQLATAKPGAPDDDDTLYNLSTGYNARAIARAQADDLAGADADYREAIAATRRVVDRDPMGQRWRIVLADLEANRGDILTAGGQRDAARASYRDAIDQMRTARGEDPQQAWLGFELSIGVEDMATLDRLEGHATDTADREVAELRAGLVATDPANVEWQLGSMRALARTGRCADALAGLRDLAPTLHHPGKLYLAATVFATCGELDAAGRAIEAAIAAGFHAPGYLRHDPWLAALRSRPELADWLRRASATPGRAAAPAPRAAP